MNQWSIVCANADEFPSPAECGQCRMWNSWKSFCWSAVWRVIHTDLFAELKASTLSLKVHQSWTQHKAEMVMCFSNQKQMFTLLMCDRAHSLPISFSSYFLLSLLTPSLLHLIKSSSSLTGHMLLLYRARRHKCSSTVLHLQCYTSCSFSALHISLKSGLCE